MGPEGKKRGETAREYVYRILRDQILTLELKPGEPFNDMEFSGRIGVSRTPVREAVIQLSQESRIIEIYPQRGMRIALIDMELVEEARALRLLLEKSVAEMACERATKEDLIWLKENVELQEFYMDGKNAKKFIELDNQMHEKLFSICRRELSYSLCQRISIHFDRVRSLSVSGVRDMTLVEDHRRLVELIEQKKSEEAVRLMEVHLNRWKLNEARCREQYPEYFK